MDLVPLRKLLLGCLLPIRDAARTLNPQGQITDNSTKCSTIPVTNIENTTHQLVAVPAVVSMLEKVIEEPLVNLDLEFWADRQSKVDEKKRMDPRLITLPPSFDKNLTKPPLEFFKEFLCLLRLEPCRQVKRRVTIRRPPRIPNPYNFGC